ncbi:MAG: PorT family protein [Bacteroidetes bacterium]|nr:MAG: PorT family protein [Bacteroidota bacterium]
MKKSIIFSLIICSTLLSYGQLSVGISTGTNISSMSVSLRDLSTFKINPTFGYNVNVIVDYKINPSLSISTGLSISSKGFNQHIKYFYMPGLDTTADMTSKLTYLELPIYLKFNATINQVSVIYGIGPYLSYGLHGKITTEITGRKIETLVDKVKWDKSRDYHSDLLNTYGYSNLKRLDFGVGTLVGLRYKNVIISASYQYGLKNLMWEYYQDEEMSNSSLSLSVGYFFYNLFNPRQI